ncbi:MAG: phosphoribosylanthranilate isomerase [Alphaproteobacteria bacterium]|nr:phosphoribosylanthranilate isomerase [Alphaproteobacteria bacterium]
MSVAVKICGLNDPAAVAAAVAGGAAYAGFVFYPRSPRAVRPALAAELARGIGGATQSVAVVVDPDDDLLAEIMATLRPAYVQLHGNETPGRAADVQGRFRVRVMKAVSIAGPEDVARADAYAAVVDALMFDAKAPPSLPDALPGGNGQAFDWRLLAGRRWSSPWLLSGGLDVGNVGEAIRLSGARAVDVSSGVEDRPGAKNPGKITAFLAALEGM